MQLVELQRTVVDSEADIAVFAISYDPVGVLSDFAVKHGISYPLLSDEGSATIRRLGVLNTQIADDQAYWGKPVAEKHQGLPFPGTFMLDASGAVTEKIFERSHRVRPGGGVLLERLGETSTGTGPKAWAEAPSVAMVASVDTREYFPNQIIRATVRLALEDGFHVYVPPNPEGFTNLSVTVRGPEGVFVLDHEMPAGHQFEIEGFDETFTVAEGDTEIVVPFYVLEDLEAVTLGIDVALQACSSSTCLVPTTLSVELDLEEIRA